MTKCKHCGKEISFVYGFHGFCLWDHSNGPQGHKAEPEDTK